MSALQTTLAQDAMRLYYNTIDQVCDNLKEDLIAKNKTPEQAAAIVKLVREVNRYPPLPFFLTAPRTTNTEME